MLVLNPKRVTFDGAAWESVSSVEVNRFGEKIAVEFGDDGPHAVFADVPEQRVNVKVVQELQSDDLDEPKPGESGELTFQAAANGSSAQRTEATLDAVVTGVQYSVSVRGRAVRTVWLVALSSDGVVDPVSVESA